jgi:NAD(P)-dependent dehydrogenase (short-subunit alcohol dehydrogenase family)
MLKRRNEGRGMMLTEKEDKPSHVGLSPTAVSRSAPADAWQDCRDKSNARPWRTSYKGSGRLNGKRAVITGGDSGIGRAIAIAYAREGADVLISYLDEHEDARETGRLVTEAGRRVVLLPGDIQDPEQCRAIIAKAVSELGGIDILVNNAAHQASFKSIDEISDGEWDLTFRVNIHAMFYLSKAAVPHMKPGACIINTASIN